MNSNALAPCFVLSKGLRKKVHLHIWEDHLLGVATISVGSALNKKENCLSENCSWARENLIDEPPLAVTIDVQPQHVTCHAVISVLANAGKHYDHSLTDK